jgi:hypothetical protein
MGRGKRARDGRQRSPTWFGRGLISPVPGAAGCDTMISAGTRVFVVGNIVEITIPVEEDAAAVLRDPMKRAALGRLVSHWVHDARDPEALFTAIERLKADAHARGLTDQIVDEELAAYNAERRH